MIDLSSAVPPESGAITLRMPTEAIQALKCIGMEKGRTPDEVVERWILAHIMAKERIAQMEKNRQPITD